MGLFDNDNEGKTTVERDSWGLKSGKLLGGEYIQERDRDGRPNGHITKECDDLGLKTGKFGGNYNQRYDGDGQRVGYSFDEGHGRMRYVDTTGKEEPSLWPDSPSRASSPSLSVRASEGSTSGYSSGGYSSSSSESSGFPAVLVVAVIVVAIGVFSESLSPQALLILKIVMILVFFLGIIGVVWFVMWYNKQIRSNGEQQREFDRQRIEMEQRQFERQRRFEIVKEERIKKQIQSLKEERKNEIEFGTYTGKNNRDLFEKIKLLEKSLYEK